MAHKTKLKSQVGILLKVSRSLHPPKREVCNLQFRVRFPLKKCWIIKTILTRTRQNLFSVFIITRFF